MGSSSSGNYSGRRSQIGRAASPALRADGCFRLPRSAALKLRDDLSREQSALPLSTFRSRTAAPLPLRGPLAMAQSLGQNSHRSPHPSFTGSSRPAFTHFRRTGYRPSCARLLSLVDGAITNSAGGPHDLGFLPAPGVGAVPVCSQNSHPAPFEPAPLATTRIHQTSLLAAIAAGRGLGAPFAFPDRPDRTTAADGREVLEISFCSPRGFAVRFRSTDSVSGFLLIDETTTRTETSTLPRWFVKSPPTAHFEVSASPDSHCARRARDTTLSQVNDPAGKLWDHGHPDSNCRARPNSQQHGRRPNEQG